ncbi:MAG: dihydropteroate synthase [Bacteroidetes bacterium]|nr:dihydropteroate synthase [Bacteroidota bacterium]
MTLNCRGKIIDLSTPVVMGILNLTPDSFFDGGKFTNEEAVLQQVEKLLRDGATIIDVGGMSSKPGAEVISVEEELKRLLKPVECILDKFPEAIISIDTIHARVADECLQRGAHIINDITAGRFDADMIPTVAKYKVPYVLMHMQGMPSDMQKNPVYENVTPELLDFFAERIKVCRSAGINDLILDVGFGFGKMSEHNFTLLRNLKLFGTFNLPVLAGVSRKGMIYKTLGIKTEDALNGTTVANTIALLNGANILRVHDVKEAREAITLVTQLNHQPPSRKRDETKGGLQPIQ